MGDHAILMPAIQSQTNPNPNDQIATGANNWSAL